MKMDRLRALANEELSGQKRNPSGIGNGVNGEHPDARLLLWLDDARWDVLQALRSYRRSLAFTAVVLATLGIGMGFAVFVFSLVEGILLEPLPFPEGDQVVRLYSKGKGPVSQRLFASSLYLEGWEEQAPSIEAVATWWPASRNVIGISEPLHVWAWEVTPPFFDVIAVPPLLGRVFTDEDVRKGNSVAVLSHAFWRKGFAGDSGVLGKRILIGGTPCEVIGIMPPGEAFLDGTAYEVWLPLDLSARPPMYKFFGQDPLIARIRAGTTIAQAQAELDLWAARLRQAHPNASGELGLIVEPYFEEEIGDARKRLFVLGAAVGLILLISCVNVAGLLLARGSGREHEIAVRSALGARRTRLVVQFITESLLLALPAGLLGLGIAQVALQAFRAWSPHGLPRLANVTIDWRALLFAVILSICSCALLALGPALRNSRVRPSVPLKKGAVTVLGKYGRRPLNSFLVVGQVALALVLMFGAGLFVRSYWELSRVHLGFETKNIVTAELELFNSGGANFQQPKYPDQEPLIARVSQIAERLQALPHIEAIGITTEPPLGTSLSTVEVKTEEPELPDEGALTAEVTSVSHDFFQVLGIRLLEGRYFGDQDTRSGELTAIVDQGLAEYFWHGGSSLGRRLKVAETWRTIVGVVGTVRQRGPRRPAPKMLYLPLGQTAHTPRVTFLARTKVPSSQFGRDLKGVVASIDTEQPVHGVAALDDRLVLLGSDERLVSLLLSLFAIIALFLAAVGLHGTLVFLVSERTQEIGLRMALGAGRVQIFRMITFKGLALVLCGLAIGSTGGLAVNRALAGLVSSWQPDSRLLFQAEALEIPVFAGVGLLLILVAFLACAIPALRAARLDPNRALHSP